MQNNDKTLLQKLKDNAFYVALGVGLLAILAVVVVYTEEQNVNVAEKEMDLNQASDYSVLSTQEENVEETNAKTANQSGTEERITQLTTESDEMLTETEDSVAEESDTNEEGQIAEANTETETEENETETAEKATEVSEQEKQIPVTSDVGELNFTSDKTIDWPVAGKVILPYSMETTVYFKTLDQYRCNDGMLIEAGSGTTIKNAFLGKVTEVTSDNTYGNLVTLSIGNDYSIVYGQLDSIYVKEGDYVKAGQSIGTIGKPTDSFTEEGSHLFFKMLKGEEAVDPMMFIE